jgi:hypothetical protein
MLTVNVGDAAGEQAAPERIDGGDLVPAVLSMHRDREAARFEEAVAPLFRRWRFHRPGQDAVCADDLIAPGFGVSHKVAQEQRLGAELEPKSLAKADAPVQIFIQHDASPGQGWAIVSSMVTSTFA